MSRLRRAICEKISQITQHKDVYHKLEVSEKKLYLTTGKAAFHWHINGRDEQELLDIIPNIKFDDELVDRVRILPATDKLGPKVEFQLGAQAYTAALLQCNNELEQPAQPTKPLMLFDFSSPNIAKPFHVGHLRSTIIGNVLANLHQYLGHKVVKMNYLGDWGTQFGMLQVGVEMEGVTDEQMRQKPIETLYAAYVAANVAAKQDATIAEKARHYFSTLEAGHSSALAKQWQLYRDYTVAALEQMYARLGVHFDQYDWESQYSQNQISEVLSLLSQQSLLLDELDGRKVVQVDGRRVPIIKSDGSTLYLTRDIAAILDRFQRYHFERIFYIVENGQADHFNALFKTTAALCKDLPLERMQHVKFGRIHGMSTRSGNAVFLHDVLDEARDIMLEKQLKSQTTKVELSSTAADFKQVADVLGVSAVVINDLKQRRQRDYDFDWHKALQVNGDTGIKLQYTHCRLCSLLVQVEHINVEGVQADVNQLNEPEAQDLLYEIARFEQVIWQAKEQLEACVLVNYLFALCNSTSRALKRLNVKSESSLAKQQNRILLFSTARRILNKSMCILGLTPLNKM